MNVLLVIHNIFKVFMRYSVVETIVGFFILITASFFALSKYTQTNPTNTGYYTIKAKFQSAEGLIVGSDVSISGVKVGAVESLSLDNNFSVIASIKLQNNISLPTDSTAIVASVSLMGGKYISIVPGGEDEIIKPNGFITFTQSSMNFEGLIAKFLTMGSSKEKQSSDSSKTFDEINK